MSPDRVHRVPGSPDEWIDSADSDLRLARLAVGDESIRREQVCFHAQQAAEKAIKAVLLFRRIEFPLTHDIEVLLHLAENNGVLLSKAVREAVVLTPYAVETRYPGYWIDISDAEVDEALNKAATIIKWARELILEKQGEDK